MLQLPAHYLKDISNNQNDIDLAVLSFCFHSFKMVNIYLFLFFTIAAPMLIGSPFPDGFDYLSNIDTSILQFPRYAVPGNFVGQVIAGYKAPKIVITTKAGQALASVQQELNRFGYSLLVYDAYRPQKAVDHFMKWVEQPQDYKTKAEFYPYIDKSQIVPGSYVAAKSGHTRGSTVDLTIIELGKTYHQVELFEWKLTNGQKILYRDDGSYFMCSHFDYFGLSSHHDTDLVTADCLEKRNLLRSLMVAQGFKPLYNEWWHYTLANEPFPEVYFDFDIV